MSEKKPRNLNVQDEVTEFLLYTAPSGGIKIEVILNNETIWLTQQRMADLFGVQRPAITKHLKNVYESGKLNEASTSSILEHVGETGQTSSEKIFHTVDSDKPLMGMMTFKNAPDGRVLKSDTIIGKNYLSEDEIRSLERAVAAFFDYIEGIIERRNIVTMEGFADSVNKFLAFNEYRVLEGYGKITRKQAEEKALAEYKKFNKQQKIESDFDKQVKALEKNITKYDDSKEFPPT